MKRILIVCLLGMGLLLPATELTAKEFLSKRIVDVTIEDDWIGITSDAGTGTLVEVEIYNNRNQKVFGESLSGYSDGADISSLSNGTYVATVTTSLTTYNEVFTLN